MSEESKKRWLSILKFLLQSAISALTALGVSSCAKLC